MGQLLSRTIELFNRIISPRWTSAKVERFQSAKSEDFLQIFYEEEMEDNFQRLKNDKEEKNAGHR